MDTTTLIETLNAATGMSDAVGICFKAIGLCAVTIVANVIIGCVAGLLK